MTEQKRQSVKLFRLVRVQICLAILTFLSVVTEATSAGTTGQCTTRPPAYQTTKAFVNIYNTATKLGTQWGSENVLLVFDIDNTLNISSMLFVNNPLI